MKRILLLTLLMLSILPALIGSNMVMGQNTASEGIGFDIMGDDDGTSNQSFLFWIDCPKCHKLFSDDNFNDLVDRVDNHIKKMHPDMTGGYNWHENSEGEVIEDLHNISGNPEYGYSIHLVNIYSVAHALPNIFNSSFIQEYEAFWDKSIGDNYVEVYLVDIFIRSKYQLLNISLSEARNQNYPFMMLCPAFYEQSGGVNRIFYNVLTHSSWNTIGMFDTSNLYIFPKTPEVICNGI